MWSRRYGDSACSTSAPIGLVESQILDVADARLPEPQNFGNVNWLRALMTSVFVNVVVEPLLCDVTQI